MYLESMHLNVGQDLTSVLSVFWSRIVIFPNLHGLIPVTRISAEKFSVFIPKLINIIVTIIIDSFVSF